MRVGIIVFVAIVGCGSGKKPEQASGSTAVAATARAVAPKVTVASVLAAQGKEPPIVVVIDDSGARVTWARTWAELATKDLAKGAKTGSLQEIALEIRAADQGASPEEIVAGWDAPPDVNDPPPPEEEPPPPEEDEDESAGTGTAITLEEGRMGKKDTDRAEGQYKMKKNLDDATLVEQQQMGGKRPLRHHTGKPMPPDPHGDPSRLMRAAGEVKKDGALEPRALALAAPAVKAKPLVDAVVALEAAIGVVHDNKVRALRLDFRTPGWDNSWGTIGVPQQRWLEARLSAKGITVEAPPEAAIEIAWASGPLDGAQLAAALDKARASRSYPPLVPVDVLVDPDVDVQRFVDLLVALDVAGVRMIGLGDAANPDELARRGKRNPGARLGQPNAQGDLDKALIRDTLLANKVALDTCFRTALAKNPALEGVVQTRFFITPNGTVAVAAADGVDPDLATCLAGAIKKLTFPKPKGGGGVQVNYPITLRP